MQEEQIPPSPQQAASGWLASIYPAALSVVSTLAIVLTLGLLAWSAIGEQGAAIGLAAAFATVSVGGSLVALISKGTLPVAGPSSATALTLGGLMVQIASTGTEGAAPLGLAAFLLAAGSAVVVMGLGQLALAASGLARVVNYVPHAVLAGFMNGVALLVVLSQLPALLGPWQAIRESGIQLGTAALGLATAALVWLFAHKRPNWPAGLIALLAGVLVWHAARVWLPGLDLGSTEHAASGGWPMPLLLMSLGDLAALEVLKQHAGAIVITGLLLALIGSMETLLSFAAIEHSYNRRPDAQRELSAMGWANIAGGLFGALPCVALRARAVAMARAGAVGPRPALLAALISALLFGLGGELFTAIPTAVLAGLMLTVGVNLIDRWSLSRFQQAWLSKGMDGQLPTLAVIGLVCAVTAVFGVAAGVIAGLVLSTTLFIRGLNRSLIRHGFTGLQRPSRRVWQPGQEAALQSRRQHIQVLELDGSLFFGSGQRLLDEAENLPPNCRWLVLDMRRLSTADESAAAVLLHLAEDLRSRGTQLLLGGLSPDGRVGSLLQALGMNPSSKDLPWFSSADFALEHAERALLGSHPSLAQPIPLAQCQLAEGLSTGELALLQAQLLVRDLSPGEVLFSQGDEANSLFVVTSGSVSAVGGKGPNRQRYSSLSAGCMVGETALLSGGGRSATIVADEPAQVLELTALALAHIRQENPALAATLFRNMAAHLAQRLRAATIAWHASAG